MEQQVGIRQGGETAGGSSGSCSGNALAFSCLRGRQQQQQIKARIPLAPWLEMGLQLQPAAAAANNGAAQREALQIREGQGQQVRAGALVALGLAR